MRAARSARWTAVVLVALVPIGCAGNGVPSSEATDDHVHHASTSAAPSTSSTPTRLDIVATEYEWSGLPPELPAGSYPMSFRNEGTEPHEISIFRNPDNVGLEELFELGPQGIQGAVEMVGTLIAGPTSSASQELTITLTPGDYEVVCFLPARSDSKPHFTHGMHRTLVVT